MPAALYREERERVEALNQQLRDTASVVGMLRGRLEVVEAERDRLLALTAGDVEDAAVVHESDPLRGHSPRVADTFVGWLRRLMGR